MLPKGQNYRVCRMKIDTRCFPDKNMILINFDLFVCKQLLRYECDSSVRHTVSLMLTFVPSYFEIHQWPGVDPYKHNLDQF